MRPMPDDMRKKLSQPIQTRSNHAAITNELWISRPTVPLVTSDFLERQEVLNSGASDIAIAVGHSRQLAPNDSVYIMYVKDSVAKVVWSITRSDMNAHSWLDRHYDKPASAVSIAFDGRMPQLQNGTSEFVTDKMPWVFRVHEGALYGEKLGSDSEEKLVETNCTDVSAVRAMWDSSGLFDYGLVVFFIVSGKIHYRQLIDGEWMDAELVSFGPSVTYTEVSAFRTWDYRVGVQAKASDGSVYILMTQFMAIGKQNTEHIELSKVAVKYDFKSLNRHRGYTDERITLKGVNVILPYGGLVSSLPPKITNCRNLDFEGNRGKVVEVIFDVMLKESTIPGSENAFKLVDSNGLEYGCEKVELAPDLVTVKLTMTDFNSAVGACKIVYTPGTIQSVVDVNAETNEFEFLPDGLVPPAVDPPKPVRAWNLNDTGTAIAIEFDEQIISMPAANASKFSLAFKEYDMVPDGALVDAARNVESISKYDSPDTTFNEKVIVLHTFEGRTNNIQNAVGNVTISYADGTLAGYGGPVVNFEHVFMPIELSPKNNPHVQEHITLSTVTVNSSFKTLLYTDTTCADAHISLNNVNAVYAFKNVQDI